MTRLLTFLLFALTAGAYPQPPKRGVHVLGAEASLHDPKYMEGTVKLKNSIRLTKPLTIPEGVEFIPGQFMLVKGNDAARIQFEGELVANRQPVFAGFLPGEIRGTFAGNPVKPEWWQHDPKDAATAINSAVKASPRLYGLTGNIVDLAAKRYLVARPIDLSASATWLRGAGMGRTQLVPTPEFVADWQNASEWPAKEGGNHGAVVWMGGKTPSVSSFNTCVTGLSINCYNASFAHPDKWITGISSKAWLEEGSIIDHVGISYFSGCGIGFPGHNGGVTVVNGLKISNVWITESIRRDSVPMLFTGQSFSYSVDTFTVGSVLYKANSRDYAAEGQSDPTIYPKPAHFLDWPKIGVKAQGIGTFSNGHVEGPQVCFWIAEGNATNQITLENIKVWMLTGRNQVWPGDGRGRKTAAPTDADPWEHSTAVLLSSTDWDLTRNRKDSLHITNLSSKGGCNRLLWDKANGIDFSAYGQGQFPQNDTGKITEYVRGPAREPGNFRLLP